MSSLLLHPTEMAQWHALLVKAQQDLTIGLNEDLESYLVFLLMRYSQKPQIAKSVLALDFLNSAQNFTKGNSAPLQDVGDKCLLFAGLFPERAKQRRLTVTYFINLGQSAYGTLSNNYFDTNAELFSDLCEEFVLLTNILQATRENNLKKLDAQKILDSQIIKPKSMH